MLKALYYPHTQLKTELILKNALLLWDEVETIVPYTNWCPTSSKKQSKQVQEATELVVRHRVPSPAEKDGAHSTLMEMLESRTFHKIITAGKDRVRPRHFREEYLVYPEKFLSRTWDELQHHGLARWESRMYDFGVPAELGLYMMSILADQCAGTQIRKITDRIEAYCWLSELQANALSSETVSGLDLSQVAPNHDRLVTLSLEILNAREIPLSKLLDMRKREAKSGGAEYSEMRRRYLSKLEAHIKRVSEEAKSESDLLELERQFKETLKVDLAALTEALRLNAKDTLLSSDVGIGALIAAGSFAVPFAGFATVGAAGIIPLAKAAVTYRSKKKEALKKHTMSWLFTAKQGKLTLY